MFHQVFICNPDDSKDLIQEENSSENAPQILKQENNTSESTAMGYVRTENSKMTVEELKSEQYTVINNQIFTKTDIQASQEGLETKNFLKVTPCSNTSSPAQMITQLPQQTAVIPPLCPTYIYQPSVENIVLQPHHTLVNMNGNLVQLSAPPVPLQTGAVAVVVPATQAINAGLTPSPTMKIEPSFSLSNVDLSEELINEKTVTNSQFKIEREEELIEDADLPVKTDSGDAEVHHGAVKFQEFIESNKSILRHIIRQSGADKKQMSLTTDITGHVSKVPLIERYSKLQKCCGNKSTEISDNELRSMYHIKECTVVQQRCITQYLTPETIQGSYLENKVEPDLEEYQYSSSSDREENHTDVDDSSGSDWEEEYLGKLRKTQGILEKGTSNSNVNTAQNMNTTNHLQNSNGKIQVHVQPIDSYTSSKDVIELKLKNNQSIPLKAQNSRNDSKRLTLDNPILKSLISTPVSNPIPDGNHVSNAKSTKNKCKQITFQLKLPFKAKINNMKLQFMPQNKIASITDIKNKLNTNSHDLTVTKFQPINDLKKGGKNLTQTEIKQKNHVISLPAAQNSKDYAQRTTPKKVLPDSRVVPSGSQSADVVDMPSSTTPPSQNDCDDGDNSENHASKIDPIMPDTYHCSNCDKYFESANQYHYHIKYSLCSGFRREARFQCDICDKRFTSREKVEAHKNSHTNARPFKCFDCDKCFNSKTARQMHHKNMHSNKKTRYLCCFCAYITPSPEHLLAHEEEHRLPEGAEAPKPFKCLVCGKGFISRWKQQKHKREHRLKKCSKCSVEFKTNSQLINHVEAVHSIIKTYDCKECGKQFKQPRTLRNHRTTHSSVLLYSCDICDKGFKRKSNLKQHMISHSDERPISCPECGESFKRITHLKQHTAAFHGDGRK